MLINYRLSGFEEVCVVRPVAVLINTDSTGFGDGLIYVESISVGDLRVILMCKQTNGVPDFMHFLLTGAGHTVNILKVHEYE